MQHPKEYMTLFALILILAPRLSVLHDLKPAKKRMTEDNARSIVRKYGKQAQKFYNEVPENVHPHLLRHSLAMLLYQNGMDLNLVSQWLGHSNLETTFIYAQADTELKCRAMEKGVPEDSPLKEHFNSKRYKVSGEEMVKRLAGVH